MRAVVSLVADEATLPPTAEVVKPPLESSIVRDCLQLQDPSIERDKDWGLRTFRQLTTDVGVNELMGEMGPDLGPDQLIGIFFGDGNCHGAFNDTGFRNDLNHYYAATIGEFQQARGQPISHSHGSTLRHGTELKNGDEILQVFTLSNCFDRDLANAEARSYCTDLFSGISRARQEILPIEKTLEAHRRAQEKSIETDLMRQFADSHYAQRGGQGLLSFLMYENPEIINRGQGRFLEKREQSGVLDGTPGYNPSALGDPFLLIAYAEYCEAPAEFFLTQKSVAGGFDGAYMVLPRKDFTSARLQEIRDFLDLETSNQKSRGNRGEITLVHFDQLKGHLEKASTMANVAAANLESEDFRSRKSHLRELYGSGGSVAAEAAALELLKFSSQDGVRGVLRSGKLGSLSLRLFCEHRAATGDFGLMVDVGIGATNKSLGPTVGDQLKDLNSRFCLNNISPEICVSGRGAEHISCGVVRQRTSDKALGELQGKFDLELKRFYLDVLGNSAEKWQKVILAHCATRLATARSFVAKEMKAGRPLNLESYSREAGHTEFGTCKIGRFVLPPNWREMGVEEMKKLAGLSMSAPGNLQGTVSRAAWKPRWLPN